MKVHFIGIGGIGVSALAQYYLAKGHQVSGSDLVSSEMTDLLKKKGAKLLIGSHKVKNLPRDADLVIYSPAIQLTNPELKEAKKRKIKRQSFPEALGKLTEKYFTIAVAGTHGKSTVTAMIGLILIKAGFDPTVILGTKLKEFRQSNFRMGKGKYLVIEADEWQASFLNYWPNIIVITNIEREHLDYYKDLNHILKTYREFISHLPRGGVLVVNGDDENIKLILRGRTSIGGSTSIYSLKQKGTQKLKKILKVPGEHNVLNALAALTVAQALKIPDKISFKALSEYKGAWRRFELSHAELRETPKENKFPTGQAKRGTTRKITVVSDYAHHPTEIKAVLKAAHQKYPKKKIWCVFQPHQYQRTFYLFNDFVKSFRKAPVDKLIITDIYDVAGREVKSLKKKVNSKKLVETVSKNWAIYLPKTKIINYLKKNLRDEEVIIIMGAGDIYEIIKELK